jgi:hypothetical protein
MICQNCGRHIRRNDTYCPHCGMEIKSEYKPLQKRYVRGEYKDRNEPYYEETPLYQEKENKPYRRGYDLDAYYPEEAEKKKSSGGLMLPVILFLLIALLIGFIFGVMIYSSNFQSIPSIG